MTDQWDVIIAGAGPAGSTAATLLARGGHRVLVLEAAHFPRFHIGESLLPFGVAVHRRLGLALDGNASVFKGGAQFVCEATNRVTDYDFAQAIDGPPRSAYHVDRSVFDARLRDLAVGAGATVRHGVRVDDLTINDEAATVRATTDGGTRLTERSRFFLDATGQDRLVAKRRKAIEPIRSFGKGAVYAHFEGVRAETFEEMGASRHIRIMVVPDGWAWVIPLPGQRLSIGRVRRHGKSTPDGIREYVDGSPLLSRWTAGSRRSEATVVSNFSYRNTAATGPRHGSIGDAACFLDPVFSSGVGLAMRHAERVADTLGPALRAGTERDGNLLVGIELEMRDGHGVLGALIDRFYNTNFASNVILGPAVHDEMRRNVISVLAGDVWQPQNLFRQMLVGAQRRRRPTAASA